MGGPSVEVIGREALSGETIGCMADAQANVNRDASRLLKGCLGAVVLVVVLPLVVVGCLSVTGGKDDGGTDGYQTSVQSQCRDLVRNRVGKADFRSQSTTQVKQPDGSTSYTTTGRADTALTSYSYTCTGVIANDTGKTLTVRLVSVG